MRTSGKREKIAVSTPGTSRITFSADAGNVVKLSVCRIRSPWTVRSMAPVNVFFRLVEKIARKASTVTPIISTAAVSAVRAGLRTALARARRPVVPRVASIGTPTTRAIGRMKNRAAIATPMNTSSRPTPTEVRMPPAPPPELSPVTISTMPPTAKSADSHGARRAKRLSGSAAPSWAAAIGGTRVARSAGRSAATSVTTVPTTSAVTTVSPLTDAPDAGSAKPSASKIASTP